jgi:hypothetical protein
MRWSDRRARARVFVPRPVRLHSRSEEQQDKHLSLRLDASRDAVEITISMKLLQILCQTQVLLKMGQRLTGPGFQFGVLAAF